MRAGVGRAAGVTAGTAKSTPEGIGVAEVRQELWRGVTENTHSLEKIVDMAWDESRGDPD